MSFIFPRGARRLPPIWVDDIPDSAKVEMFDMLMKDMLKRPLRYINVGGYDMHNDKEELMKELIKKRANDELESDPLVPTPLEMLKEEIENSVNVQLGVVARKKRLMRLEKEHLVDMVFNLESKNETLVNNLIEVEKMYNKLKEEKENG